MLPQASEGDNMVACHSAEHPCGASALRGLPPSPCREGGLGGVKASGLHTASVPGIDAVALV